MTHSGYDIAFLSFHFHAAEAHGGYSVFAGVGERTREGNDLYKVNIALTLITSPSEAQCLSATRCLTRAAAARMIGC